jgi:ABC-type multidrug transport system ATPase subunit
MLEIHLSEVGKKYQMEWIFQKMSLKISGGSKWAIKGGNGSGKTTLLNCIAGKNPITSGQITYHWEGKEILAENIFKHLVISAPYLELPEEFSLKEILHFHFQFKNPIQGLSEEDMVKTMYLESHVNKSVAQFSSGMKQRLKLGLCFFSDTPLLLLDEPTSNLDEKGVNWYQEMVKKYIQNRTVIISSNEDREYSFCDHIITMDDFKSSAKGRG